jgi:hypothetical protein
MPFPEFNNTNETKYNIELFNRSGRYFASQSRSKSKLLNVFEAQLEFF